MTSRSTRDGTKDAGVSRSDRWKRPPWSLRCDAARSPWYETETRAEHLRRGVCLSLPADAVRLSAVRTEPAGLGCGLGWWTVTRGQSVMS